MQKFILTYCIFFFITTQAMALEIAGVQVPETISTDLQLNGAGIRSKFFFKIYIAELYLQHPAKTAAEILGSNDRKRMTMHILYNEVSKEKLVNGWNDGFEANLSTEQLKQLSPQITQFNSLFVNVHEGEEIILDYKVGSGTTVTIAGIKKGIIRGADFNRALLSIWIGREPVTEGLRDELLGKN